MSTNFVKVHKWQEFHENGQLWIDGEIAIVPETLKHLHDYRDGWYDNGKYFIPKDIPVCRIGVWTKFFDNGQIACKIDYADGMRDGKIKRQTFVSYRKDGTVINNKPYYSQYTPTQYSLF
jgi:antitoxin component YwqK of YwqJK toxin-antitoxin module